MKTFRIFYSFIWEYQWSFIVSILTGFISTALGNFVPFIYRYIVDNFYNFNFKTFFFVAGVYGTTRIGMIMRADKIIVLDNGEVIEEGLHDELISKSGGIYKKLWELQTDHEIE